MGFTSIFQKLCQNERMKLIVAFGVISFSLSVFQFSSLPHGNVLSSIRYESYDYFTRLHGYYVYSDIGVENNVGPSGVSDGVFKETNRNALDKFLDDRLEVPEFVSKDLGQEPEVEKIGRLEYDFTSLRSGSSVLLNSTNSAIVQGKLDSNSSSIFESTNSSLKGEQAKKGVVEATSVSQMNTLLLESKRHRKSRKPRQSSERDRELQDVKVQIENAPITENDQEIYAPVFRNLSMFRRSYELMEDVLKVYIYKEGGKPIFHHPNINGIYGSEGWFMKLMKENKKFVVDDPQQAHLFYLPFSSTTLRSTLFDPEDRKKLSMFLKSYVSTISSSYRFWNRTRGEDHFLVACHDWAPKVTSKAMGNCIRSLCNANIASNFRIGQDVSLPVTFVRNSQAPSRNLGGKPPSKRSILAFFAGSMHGDLRTILLEHWENKDSDMKIFGASFLKNKGKMTYVQYMKSSKYCICAKGYEVHTPRVVEAIFYDCVPVIISDNYLPPFFDILDWEKFAVFVQEKDVPNLKSILTSISEKKYREKQINVRKVQIHFLWHKKPVKFDIFHMILHSVWLSRVSRVRLK